MRRLIDKEGASCLRDAGRFRSLWMDYVPQSKEAKLILSAVQEGVGSTLLAAKDKDEDGQRQSITRCEQQMVEAFITEEGSKYAVREIASALNMNVDRIMPVPAGVEDGNLQPRRGPGSVSRQIQEPVPSSKRQEISPVQERYPRQQERQNKAFPAESALRETPVKKKSKLPWVLLALLLIIGGATAGMFLTRGNNTVPAPPVEEDDVTAIVPPMVLPKEENEPPEEESEPSEEDVRAIISPVVLPVDEDTEVPPVVEPEPEPETVTYEIDTIASNVKVRSMVIDNGNNLYYVVGNAVYCTAADGVMDFSDDNSNVCYLAHDPYNDKVYLLINKNRSNPTIIDITNYWDLEPGAELAPVLNRESQSGLPGTFGMRAGASYTPQIGALKNGALKG